MKEPFEKVIAEYGATVLRVCRAVLGAGHDADDAWSETFMAALQAWPELPTAVNMEAWLVRVAHRKAIDVTRQRTRQAIPTDSLPEHPSPYDNPGADHLDLWLAVSRLPDRQRLAVAYHYFGGLRHRETAQLIGGTPDSVRRAASDGIRSLRKTLSQWEEVPDANQ